MADDCGAKWDTWWPRPRGHCSCYARAMNAPIPPPVDLSNLRNLALAKKTRGRASSAAPLAGTVLAAAGVLVWRLASARRSRRRSYRGWWMAGAGLAVVGVARWQLQRWFSPQPAYEVERDLGELELRRYPAVRVAATTVEGTWELALNEGFRRLAGFIFGKNDRRERITMTAPVLGTGDGNGYRLTFVLPEGVVPPSPDDARVEVGELPSRRVAVLRFNGGHDALAIESHKRELAHALARHGLHPRGEATFAGYDPPTTLPVLRRNELWVELEG